VQKNPHLKGQWHRVYSQRLKTKHPLNAATVDHRVEDGFFPNMLNRSILQCSIHASFEEFHPDSGCFSFAPLTSSNHFLPKESRGRHDEHNDSCENGHSRHFRL
jgi:hypothetical protein